MSPLLRILYRLRDGRLYLGMARPAEQTRRVFRAERQRPLPGTEALGLIRDCIAQPTPGRYLDGGPSDSQL